MKVGQFIEVRYNGFARARRPYSFTLPPRDASETFARAAGARGRGGKYVLHFPTLFRRRSGRFTIYLHASKVCKGERAEKCHHCCNELYSHFVLFSIGTISVLPRESSHIFIETELLSLKRIKLGQL